MNNPFFYLEDDVALAQVTSDALDRRGYGVAHFASLAEASRGIGERHYDYALLDLKLGDGYSLPLIEQLLSVHPAIKIVVLTGYASLATAVQAVKMGAVNYLAKPATVDDILRAYAEPEEGQAQPDDAEAMSLRRREWEAIQTALAANEGNISATARQLKMHRRTLQRKLQKKPVSE